MLEQTLPPSHLSTALQKLVAEIRENPRLQVGLLTISAIFISWALLFVDDVRKESITKLESLREQNARMHTQLGSPSQQVNLQLLLQKNRDQIEAALWNFSAPVIAQAELSDWIRNTLKDNGVTDPVITQPLFRNTGDQSVAEKNTPLTQPSICEGALCDIIEIRTNVHFRFDSNSLVKVLASLENAKQLIRIDQATFNSQGRQADISLVTHARITELLSTHTLKNSHRASATMIASTPATAVASAPESKKIVEIKW